MRTKHLYLTRGEDRKFVLSSREPIVATIEGTRRMGLYPDPGENYWVPHLCLESVREMFLDDGPLPAFNEPVPVILGGELTRSTWVPMDHEERRLTREAEAVGG